MKDDLEKLDNYFVEALSIYEGKLTTRFKTKFHLMLLYLRIRSIFVWLLVLAGIGIMGFFYNSSTTEQSVKNQNQLQETHVEELTLEENPPVESLSVIAFETSDDEIDAPTPKTTADDKKPISTTNGVVKTSVIAIDVLDTPEDDRMSQTALKINQANILLSIQPKEHIDIRKIEPIPEAKPGAAEEDGSMIALVSNDATPKKRWLSLAVFASPDITQTRLSEAGAYEEYLNLRNDSESDAWTWSAGADIRVHFKNWFIQTGINYSSYKNNKDFNYSYSVYDSVNSHFEYDTTWVWVYNPPNLGFPLMTGIDTIWVPVYQDIHVEDQGKNEWSYLEIPVLIGHQFVSGKFGFEVASGVSMGFLTKSKGSLPRFPGTEGMENLEDLNGVINKTMLNWLLQVGISYQLSERWSIIAQPYYKQSLQSVFDKNYPIDQRFKAFGLKCGLRVRF